MAALNFPEAIANGQVFEADTGVIYTYIGTPPNGYWSGFAQDAGSDSLNALYVEKNDKGTKQTITGGGGLDLAGTIQLNSINGSAEFNGVVEAGSGVKVMGGSTGGYFTDGLLVGGSADNAIIGFDNDARIRIRRNDNITLAANSTKITGIGYISALLSDTHSVNTDDKRACGFITQPAITEDFDSYSCYLARPASNAVTSGKTVKQMIGFTASNGLNTANNVTESIGFAGNLDAGYNFFSNGTAPNFFQGNTYIGGTATRNTRELWESTLTEEQKEQLSAGTLAIPANVSTPGDGSYVRQWWYDQQSAEDQALIDAGELDYPSHFQAANFVDTFALGDNTRIDLKTDGSGVFKESNQNAFVKFSQGSNSLEKIITVQRAGVKAASNTAFQTKAQNAAGDAYVPFYELSYTGNQTFYGGGVEFDMYDDITDATRLAALSFKLNGEVQATINTLGRFDSKMGNKPTSENCTGFQTEGDVPLTNGSDSVVCYRADAGLATGHDSDLYVGFRAIGTDAQKGNPTEAAGLDVIGYTDIGQTNYGVKSNLSTTNNSNNYNFYAEGSAPNYFAGLTEHKGGVKVSGGNVTDVFNGIYRDGGGRLKIAAQGKDAVNINYVGSDSVDHSANFDIKVKSTPSLSGTEADAVSFISVWDTAAGSSVSTITGFRAARGSISAGTTPDKVVGFDVSDTIGNLSPTNGVTGYLSNVSAQTNSSYNFYAAGSAPNYFKGYTVQGPYLGWDGTPGNLQPWVDTWVTDNTHDCALINSGITISRYKSTADYAFSCLTSNLRGANASHMTFKRNGAIEGSIRSTNGGVTYATDATGTPAFVELGDARNRTYTDFSGNAVDTLKLLQPKVNGFNPAQLQSVVANAVTGTENATEAIGTLTDAAGVVTTDVPEPESMPYGETWVQTGTRPVYQGVDQTKLIPLLTKALQEALERIEALEAAQA